MPVRQFAADFMVTLQHAAQADQPFGHNVEHGGRSAVKQIFRQVRTRPTQRLFQPGTAFGGAVFALVLLHYAREQLFRADRQRGEVEIGVVAVEIVENSGVHGFVRVLLCTASTMI